MEIDIRLCNKYKIPIGNTEQKNMAYIYLKLKEEITKEKIQTDKKIKKN